MATEQSQATASVTEYSSDYIYIDTALRARWPQFKALRAEVSNFSPKSIDQFEELRQKLLADMRGMNPHIPEAQLEEDISSQVTSAASPDMQRWAKFGHAVMSEYVTTVFLSHALCEALINVVLATQLAKKGVAGLFTALESASFMDKWLHGPKAYCAAYELRTDQPLGQTLTRLNNQRNALVHYKVHLKVDGTKVLDGSKLRSGTQSELLDWAHRYYNAPYDLATLLLYFDRSCSASCYLHNRDPIERAEVHFKHSPEVR